MDDELSAGLMYKPYEQMKDLYEKLTLLKYHDEFVKTSRIRPIHNYYFISPTNPGEQYYNFVSIASWLITKCRRSITMPEESDDPNLVISGILEHIRALGGQVDYSPSKVKSGSGPEVVSALLFLANAALKTNRVQWEEITKEDVSDEEDNVMVLEEQEVNLEKVEEEMDQIYSSDEDEEPGWMQQSGTADFTRDEQMQILKSDMDAEAWRLEVERVLPQLKITVKTDGQDWRWRHEQMASHVTGLKNMIDTMEGPIQRITTDAQNMSDKVLSREAFLNNQFAPLLNELHQAYGKMSKMKDLHKELSTKVTEKNKILAQLADELEQTRRQLEERGSIMADGAPVVATRKNLNNLKKELGDMEVEIGVMEHSLMKTLVQEQMILRDKNKF